MAKSRMSIVWVPVTTATSVPGSDSSSPPDSSRVMPWMVRLPVTA